MTIAKIFGAGINSLFPPGQLDQLKNSEIWTKPRLDMDSEYILRTTET